MLSGGVLFSAFFLIPDTVSTPMTRKGGAVFALGTALITMALWQRMNYFSVICLSVLMMNTLTPWIDRWVRPRRSHIL